MSEPAARRPRHGSLSGNSLGIEKKRKKNSTLADRQKYEE